MLQRMLEWVELVYMLYATIISTLKILSHHPFTHSPEGKRPIPEDGQLACNVHRGLQTPG